MPENKEDLHVFVLMGQSNMSGYGLINNGDKKPVPRVVNLPWHRHGNLKWWRASHPLHNRNRYDRFGLGLPFAQHYLNYHEGAKVALLALAEGGAPIELMVK